MNEFIYPILLTAVVALVTGLLRFLPFWVFAKGTPRTVLYLGATLTTPSWVCWSYTV